MKECCDTKPIDKSFGKILWVALALNILIFFVEIFFSFKANSSSLIADSLDFLGDSFNYGLSLFVITMSALVRSKTSQVKALTMIAFGGWVIFDAINSFKNGVLPRYEIMSSIGILAFAVNLLVAGLLYRFRSGDSQMRSVWLCTRNDVIGNLAVIGAAVGIYYTDSGTPDIIVAVVMAYLSISSGVSVFKQARNEIVQITKAERL